MEFGLQGVTMQPALQESPASCLARMRSGNISCYWTLSFHCSIYFHAFMTLMKKGVKILKVSKRVGCFTICTSE